MKPQPPDTEDLSMKSHAWLLALTVALVTGCFFATWHPAPDPVQPGQSRYHDASLDLETQPITFTPPVTTPQAAYEAERAGAHGLEYTDLETTAEKLDRIRRRDAAANATRLKTAN